jgi:protein-S-isoprenylcysteine O-methyltransferase Ste14
MFTYNLIAFLLVLLCWFAFAAVFIVFLGRKPTAKAPEQKRDVRSRAGIILQGVSYGIVWSVPRRFRPLLASSPKLDVALMILAVVLAVLSVWLVMAAVRQLGKEWSLTARLVEGHRLVTTGPYALVRHPIYTGMAGMLLATGLTHSHLLTLLLGVVVFTIGTVVRVRSEERLLRAEFGAEFDAYARRVPAVVPWLF